jgi:GNAT superfamily N-acetyltransferase
MNYDLCLKYDGKLKLNLKNCKGEYFDTHFTDIIYTTDEEENAAAAADEDYEGTRIGFVQLLYYNQALAIAKGISMSEVKYMALQRGFKALKELDYTHITEETIDEIGEATNKNIMVISRFGISAAWRNKGIGEQLLKGFVEQMKGKCGYVVILYGTPAQCEDKDGYSSTYENRGVELAGLEKDPEKAQWKLNAFFQRCGFRLFKNFDNVFICNVDQAVPDRMMVKKTEK